MIPIRIGTELKKAREKNRLSQQEVADYLNISQKTISNIESEKSLPSLIHLVNFIELYQMDLDKVLKELIRLKGNSQSGSSEGSDPKTIAIIELKKLYEQLLKEKNAQIFTLELNYSQLTEELKRVNVINKNRSEM